MKLMRIRIVIPFGQDSDVGRKIIHLLKHPEELRRLKEKYPGYWKNVALGRNKTIMEEE